MTEENEIAATPLADLMLEFDLTESDFAPERPPPPQRIPIRFVEIGENRILPIYLASAAGEEFTLESGRALLRPFFPTLEEFEKFRNVCCDGWNRTSYGYMSFALQALALGAYDFEFIHPDLIRVRTFGEFEPVIRRVLFDFVDVIVALFGFRLDQVITNAVRKRLLKQIARNTQISHAAWYWCHNYQKIVSARTSNRYAERTFSKQEIVNDLYMPWQRITLEPVSQSVKFLYAIKDLYLDLKILYFEWFGPRESILDRPICKFILDDDTQAQSVHSVDFDDERTNEYNLCV